MPVEDITFNDVQFDAKTGTVIESFGGRAYASVEEYAKCFSS
jgi:hypothetical protein